MKFYTAAAFLLALVDLSEAKKALRGPRGLSSEDDDKTSPVYHYKLSDQDWDPQPGGQLKIANTQDLGFNMQFGVVNMSPGGVRDLHWHRKAAEWAYISNGTCEFTLMDDNNRYVNGVANTGDVYFFPLGWQHSIQGIHRTDGCTTLLWFDDVDGAGSINLSDTIAAYPYKILKASLNNIPEEATLAFPKKQNGVAKGEIQESHPPPSNFPLDLWPVFPVSKGTISDSGKGGVEFAVRQEQLLATLTMSGGRIELEEGGMRELHWHTNADELHYVLSGTVRNIVHSNRAGENATEYTISAGDIGYVPLNFVHYLEAVGGPAVVIVAFNHPSWGTQGLSAMMSVTPTYVTAATLTSPVEVAEEYFPQESTAFVLTADDETAQEKTGGD